MVSYITSTVGFTPRWGIYPQMGNVQNLKMGNLPPPQKLLQAIVAGVAQAVERLRLRRLHVPVRQVQRLPEAVRLQSEGHDPISSANVVRVF